MILVKAKRRNHDREMQTHPSSGVYNLECDDTNVGEELEMIEVSRKPFRWTNTEPESDRAFLSKIVCVKLGDDIPDPGEMTAQMMALMELVKSRYRLSDLIRSQKNNKMTSCLSK